MKDIPILFESSIVDSPVLAISEISDKVYEVKIRAFTKYANRNGSYITDAVADQLIESATNGATPVIGFFDPETQTWASHTGPKLAKAYGYVDSFYGWVPFTDTDGATRDYAVFNAMLFIDYFEEANTIVGQNQSMELDIKSISGDWAEIGGSEYYVYTTAKMAGFCVIGAHEPCFSVSAFFSQQSDTFKEQYEQFSSLLFELKAQVEEARKGGEQPMNELENQELENPVVEEEQVAAEPEVEFAAEPEVVTEEVAAEEEAAPEAEVEFTVVDEPKVEEPVEEEKQPEVNTEFETLQQSYNDLQNSYNQLQADYAAAQNKITDLEAEKVGLQEKFEAIEADNAQMKTVITNYENERKNSLIEKYENLIGEEEISHIREMANDFSYDELEGKLAIAFANKQMTGGVSKKVPLPEPEKSQFALLMEKYRKN